MEKELATHWKALADVATGYGLELIAAFVILVFGWWLAGRVQKLILRSLNRLPMLSPRW